MKIQVPDVKIAPLKRLSPELAEILHMLKSLESDGKTVEVVPFRE